MMLRTRPHLSLLARSQSLFRALHGNGVIGIRREDKNEWERRVPLAPEHVSSLVDSGLRVLVQPSSTRCFPDVAYSKAGAEVVEDLSPAGTIFAVKEVPVDLILPDRTYVFFSHTIKGQESNMPLLDVILKKNVRLIDYEKIVHPSDQSRIVKFGPFAGYAGVVDTIRALGRACLARGYATPFLFVSPANEYRSLDAARSDLIACGDSIRDVGLPPDLCPLSIVITGRGSVSIAAQQMLHTLPCTYVTPSELAAIHRRKEEGRPIDTRTVYVAVVDASDMVRHKAGKQFEKAEYYAFPHLYEPVFGTNVLPYTSVLINGMFWSPRFPRLVSVAEARQLYSAGNFKLLVLGDITCDPSGSVEFFSRSTPISDPLYAWDPESNQAFELPELVHGLRKRSVLIMGVDHLPAEFPRESSEYFGHALVPFVEDVARNALKMADLPAEVQGAVVTQKGTLTEPYAFIEKLQKDREAKRAARRARDAGDVEGADGTDGAADSGGSDDVNVDIGEDVRVLVLGAGMCAGPAVAHLLKNPAHKITLADASLDAVEDTLGQYAAHHVRTSDGSGRPDLAVRPRVRGASVNVSEAGMDGLNALVEDADVVLSLVPAPLHPLVMTAAAAHKVDVVTASYPPPDAVVAPITKTMKDAKRLILHGCGLDPGLDLMSTVGLLSKIRADGANPLTYSSFCGALSAPEISNNCMQYKFSWSPMGVLTACMRPATFRWAGETITVPDAMTYNLVRPFRAEPLFGA